MHVGEIDGTAYEVAGAGPPVVLVHGLGLNRHMWDGLSPALAGHFRVVRYDLLGHGASAAPEEPVDLKRFTGQLRGLLDGLDLPRAALIGFSLGGLIVRAFALAHPDRVTALAILNSPHDRSAGERAAVRARVRQAEEGGPAATVEAALSRWFTADFAARHPEVLERVRGWVLATDARVYPRIYRVLAEADADLAEAIAAIGCPTLVVTGGEDQGNSPEMARRMAALIPGARAEVVPGLRHLGLIERPEAFADLLVPFLAAACGRAPGG